ncbi:MAG TPA: hypothetical protein DD458_20265 [Prolixibacteraceae bacterium]|nr:hypothetical protein [Prolixibacteraceae bacterium]HCU60363.1 hypothetical protein [Prolixibacteraceae bacterium]
MKRNIDKKLFELMQSNHVGEPKEEIEDRLMYTFMLKNGTSTLRQNSFAEFAGWFFSFKNMGIKTATLSCLLIVTLMNTNLHQKQATSSICDSTFVEKALVLDSTSLSSDFNVNSKDTSF